MKSCALLMSLAVMFLLVSCSASIAGTWQDEQGTVKVEFNRDSTFSVDMLLSGQLTGTYELSGSKLTLNYNERSEETKVARKGDVLSFSFNGVMLTLDRVGG